MLLAADHTNEFADLRIDIILLHQGGKPSRVALLFFEANAVPSADAVKQFLAWNYRQLLTVPGGIDQPGLFLVDSAHGVFCRLQLLYGPPQFVGYSIRSGSSLRALANVLDGGIDGFTQGF